MLNWDFEQNLLWEYDTIVSLDEVGRGAWAGPLVFGATILSKGFNPRLVDLQLDDSKKLSKIKREIIYDYAVGGLNNKNLRGLELRLFEKSPADISANGLASSISAILQQVVENCTHGKTFFLFDGGLKIPEGENGSVEVKGDGRFASIALSANYAKVYRDRLMATLEPEYPRFSFAKHMGYGTKMHITELKNFGPTKIHRLNYKPIQKIISANTTFRV